MTSSRGVATHSELLDAPINELATAAFDKARLAYGNVVTYSPKVFIPLTKLCRDRCGYCTFAQAPAHVDSPYMALDEVMAVAQAGRDAGCTEALFTLGERPELRYDEAARWLAARGYESTVDYVANAPDGAREHRPAPARQRRRPLPSRTRSAADGLGVPGHDDRSARGPRGASPRARQRPAATTRHVAIRRGAE